MTAPAAARPLPREVAGPRAPGWWGMLLLILTEAALFAALLAAYFYIRVSVPEWPLGGLRPPELLVPGINTVLLLASSASVWWAEHSLRAGRPDRLKLGLVIAIVLGGAFLGLQLFEYSRSEFAPQANAYASLFFTITGLHGSHVLAGLIVLIVVTTRAWLGHFDSRHYLGMQAAALYWHFVDVVWLFVFTSLYLSPRW